MPNQKRYAELSWVPEDLMARFQVTREQAEIALIAIEDSLRDYTTTKGWDFIEDCQFSAPSTTGGIDLQPRLCQNCGEEINEYDLSLITFAEGDDEYKNAYCNTTCLLEATT